MQEEKNYMQHGSISVYAHSVNVACTCLMISRKLPLAMDERSLVRGALLHDYFLYDWHDPDPSHRLHGFYHPGKALNNALKDFQLNDIEKDMIVKHMFPLTLVPPKYRESILICIADKLCALCETGSLPFLCFQD
ncbi:MAG: HD domain-containing protein [Eubacterium sp.]|nr:HD domain-containing protein [Eubacterium sp.]